MRTLRESNLYTYEDYANWDTDERYELIDGAPYLMSPAPLRKHQRVVGRLYVKFSVFLEGRPCEAYIAPFDVRLNADGRDDTVVQPDITVVCDKSKLDDKGCKGVPDLIVEVLSPSSVRHDKITKFNRYLQAGVPEYWIVDPDRGELSVHILENGKYFVRTYSDDDTAPVHTLQGCEIPLRGIFGE